MHVAEQCELTRSSAVCAALGIELAVKVCFTRNSELRCNPSFVSCSFGLTASPAMRGSTPLDVAAASVMDNNELALALREPDLEKVGSPLPLRWCEASI